MSINARRSLNETEHEVSLQHQITNNIDYISVGIVMLDDCTGNSGMFK